MLTTFVTGFEHQKKERKSSEQHTMLGHSIQMCIHFSPLFYHITNQI